MPQTTTNNESIARAFYDHVYAGEVDAVLAMLSDDFTWLVGVESDDLTAAIPWAGRILRGRDGFAELNTTLFGEFEVLEFEAREFHPAGDHVFVEGHFRFRHKTTGKTAASDWLARFDITGGQIQGGHFFENTYAVAAARS